MAAPGQTIAVPNGQSVHTYITGSLVTGGTLTATGAQPLRLILLGYGEKLLSDASISTAPVALPRGLRSVFLIADEQAAPLAPLGVETHCVLLALGRRIFAGNGCVIDSSVPLPRTYHPLDSVPAADVLPHISNATVRFSAPAATLVLTVRQQSASAGDASQNVRWRSLTANLGALTMITGAGIVAFVMPVTARGPWNLDLDLGAAGLSTASSSLPSRQPRLSPPFKIQPRGIWSMTASSPIPPQAPTQSLWRSNNEHHYRAGLRDSWAPAGLAGDTVKIDASEILGTTKGGADLLTTTGANSVYLKLDAPQVAIADSDVIGVYPASGSTTSPDEYLPHIALARYTLPWERIGPAPGKPWLALILFKASDLADPSRALSTIGPLQVVGLSPQIVATGTVRTAAVTEKFVGNIPPTGPGSPQSIPTQPAAPVSTGTTLLQIPVSKIQSADSAGYKQLTDATTGCGIDPATQVNALYLSNSVWKTIQPALADISLLCHVAQWLERFRVRSHHWQSPAPACPRRPAPLPNRTPPSSFPSKNAATFSDAGNKRAATDTVALLGLRQWTFTPSAGRDFADAIQMIADLPEGGGVLRFGNLPSAPAAGAPAPLTRRLRCRDRSRRLSRNADSGFFGRLGLVSRAPRPFATTARENSFAVHAAPQGFVAAPCGTPPDYSYASAFELGRLTALSDAGLVEDLREVHAVLDLPKQFFAVSSPAPQALLVKTWSEVQTDWYQEPWAAPSESPLPATADVSGISGQVSAWASSIAVDIGGASTRSLVRRPVTSTSA